MPVVYLMADRTQPPAQRTKLRPMLPVPAGTATGAETRGAAPRPRGVLRSLFRPSLQGGSRLRVPARHTRLGLGKPIRKAGHKVFHRDEPCPAKGGGMNAT